MAHGWRYHLDQHRHSRPIGPQDLVHAVHLVSSARSHQRKALVFLASFLVVPSSLPAISFRVATGRPPQNCHSCFPSQKTFSIQSTNEPFARPDATYDEVIEGRPLQETPVWTYDGGSSTTGPETRQHSTPYSDISLLVKDKKND